MFYIQFPTTSLLNLFKEPIAVIAESFCICAECEVCLLFTVIQCQLPLLGRSGYCYRSAASGIGFRSVLDRWKLKHVLYTHTHTLSHSVLVCVLVYCSECAQVLRPAERDTLLDAGKRQTEKGICQSLNGILPMLLMRHSLCPTHTHTHTY